MQNRAGDTSIKIRFNANDRKKTPFTHVTRLRPVIAEETVLSQALEIAAAPAARGEKP
jgi:hypothetical protein